MFKRIFTTVLLPFMCVAMAGQGGGPTPQEQARMDRAERRAEGDAAARAKLPMTPAATAVKPPAADGMGDGDGVVGGGGSPDGLIYLLQRGDKADPVIAVDRDGKIVRSWGKGMYTMPHAIRVDPQGNVWTTDAVELDGLQVQAGRHAAPEDRGRRPTGAVRNNFCSTTDIAFARDGHLFIADGYRNARILEYTADGKKLQRVGQRRHRSRTSSACRTRSRSTSAASSMSPIARTAASSVSIAAGKFLGEWTQYGKTFGLKLVGDAMWLSTIPRGPNSAPGWLIKIDRDTGALLRIRRFRGQSRHGRDDRAAICCWRRARTRFRSDTDRS